MPEHDWPAVLLADRGRMQLEIFADWLTDAGDPLADGVRWLAREEKRPAVFTAIPLVAWNIKKTGPTALPKAVNQQMARQTRSIDAGSSPAEIYYRSLLDAAQAYLISLNPPKPPHRLKRVPPKRRR